MKVENILFISSLILLIVLLVIQPKEGFDVGIGLWDWTSGNPGDDGYAMWGVWPESIPDEPWRPWMWGRRPKTFVKYHTPVPQIDYNNTTRADPNGKYETTLYFSTITTDSGEKLLVDGEITPVLQLDRERVYYFQVYLPNNSLVLTDDSGNIVYGPMESNNGYGIMFPVGGPNRLFYSLRENPECRGIIYFNDIKAKR